MIGFNRVGSRGVAHTFIRYEYAVTTAIASREKPLPIRAAAPQHRSATPTPKVSDLVLESVPGQAVVAKKRRL